MPPPTIRQKQFLRRLGHKDFAKLTKESASQLIDKLLAQEKESGKTFPCPYCKARFGPRPRREKICPSCGNLIVHLCGKFYTEEQVDELNQKDWLKDMRKHRNSEVKEEWRDERRTRKETDRPIFAGFIVKAGPNCPHTKKLAGLIVLLEDAYDAPDLLPPYDECRHDTCECEYEIVMVDDVPRDARIAQWTDAEQRAKLKTRANSPVSIQGMGSGCATLLIAAIVTAASALVLIAAF